MNLLEQIMKKEKLNAATLSEELDISKSYTSMIIKGERNISLKLMKKIREKYNLSWNKIMEEV
jgi:transcriptional regulator with XRE-family HTH domain|tara:strand:- start:29 stop:217 length:189 start_codon:yes stop_codon:yes gene_type:complete